MARASTTRPSRRSRIARSLRASQSRRHSSQRPTRSSRRATSAPTSVSCTRRVSRFGDVHMANPTRPSPASASTTCRSRALTGSPRSAETNTTRCRAPYITTPPPARARPRRPMRRDGRAESAQATHRRRRARPSEPTPATADDRPARDSRCGSTQRGGQGRVPARTRAPIAGTLVCSTAGQPCQRPPPRLRR